MSQKKKPANPSKQQLNKFGSYSNVAFQLLASIALFTYLGTLVDAYFGSKKPIFTAILSVFGVAAGLYLVVKQVKNTSEKEN